MIDLNGIKNIIFDFGGVIIDIDFQAIKPAFEKLGVSDFSTLYSQFYQTQLFDQFEMGTVSPQEFRTELKKLLPKNISDCEIDNAWNSMVLQIPDQRVQLLQKLKTRYRTFLLSNTNKIHYDFYLKNFRNDFGLNDFSELFEKTYFSFEMGMKKPNIDIFQYVLSQNRLIPQETIFIDDTEANLRVAKEMGMLTYLLPKGKDICELFRL